MNAAERIRIARRDANMTQDELAARSGVRQPNVASYESGRRSPSEAMLARLLAAARPRPSLLLARHRQEVLDLADRNRAIDVRIFGSVARGEDTADSDIDLLVTFDPGATILDQIGLVDDLQRLLGPRVDVVSDQALTERDASIQAEAIPL